MKYELDKIGERLRARREELRMTLKVVGEKLNISLNQVSRHELGKANPTLELLLKYCEIYECELGYLLGEEEYLSGTKLNTAIEEKTGLTPKTINCIHNMLFLWKYVLKETCNSKKRSLNDLLSNPHFDEVINCLVNLNTSYEIYTKNKAEMQKSIKNNFETVMETNSEINDMLINLDNPDTIKSITESVEILNLYASEYYIRLRESEYKVKVNRFDLSESFRVLIDDMYPFESLNHFTISK